jgi:PAS domain S-box-containing protein
MAFDSDHGQAINREALALLPVGLISAELAEILFRDPNPAMILAADGRTPLWSSHEAARRFGYRDAQSFMRARLPATAPGTLRLEQIGSDGLDAATPRLERLRYFIGFRGVVLTALCRVIPLADGREAILVAFPLGDVADLPAPAAEPASVVAVPEQAETAELASANDAEHELPQPDFFERDLTIRPASDLIRQARAMLGKSEFPAVEELEPLAPASQIKASAAAAIVAVPAGIRSASPDVANTPEQTAPRALPSRFLFALDAQGRLVRDVLGIEGLTGSDRLIAGAFLADALDDIDPNAAAALRAGIASGETWQPIMLEWPRADAGGSATVRLTALPLIDASRGLTGYSGFGRIDRAASNPVDEPEAPSRATIPGPLQAAGLAGGVLVGLSTPEDALAEDNEEALGTEEDWPEVTVIEDEDPEAAGLVEDDKDITEEAPDRSQSLPAGEIDRAAWADQTFDFGDPAPLNAVEDAINPPSAEELQAVAANMSPLLADEMDAIEANSAAEAGDPALIEGDEALPPPPGLDRAETASRITPFPTPGGRRKADPPGPQNVVSIHNGQPSTAMPGFQRQGLSMTEKNAFREIARALGARFAGGDESESITSPLSATGGRPESNAARDEQESAVVPMTPAAIETGPVDREQDNIAGGPNPHFGLGDGVAGFLDRLPLGLMVLKDEAPLFVNRTLLDLTGYPDFASFIRENGARAIFRKGIAPRQQNRLPDPMVLATREGEMVPVDAQLQLVDWDGSPATLISVRRAVELEQGKALRTVAMDLKSVRAEAHELRAILDTATDGVLTLDASGQIVSMNGTAQALFGLHQNEIIGEHFTRLFVNESHAIAMDYLDGLKLGGVRSVLNDGREVQGVEKNGGKMPLFMTLGRISADDPPRFCAVLRDITAWKRAETDLTEARRVAESSSAKKSDFLAKISHEIRTPMNAIIGFSEVMQEERLGPIGTPKYKEYLADIRTSGQHVVSLVNDLLDLAKIEAGRMELDFQATDLNAIVQSAVQIIQPQANTARVLVRSQLAQKLPPVVADERSVRQIVLNILSNATRFTESGGQVIVSTSLLEGGEAVIRIRDTGIGMSGPEIEQALEPFRQVGHKHNKGGTGLGLPLTKALVEANRANFAIRSQPGEGTLVEVAFPSTRVLAE